MGWFSFFKRKHTKKRSTSPLVVPSYSKGLGIFSALKNSKGQVSETISLLEETLLTGDVSISVVKPVLEELTQLLQKDKSISIESFLKARLGSLLVERPLELDELGLNILFVFGVNGVGKTTTIAKLARFFQNQGKNVALAAADTYRAAATDQLKSWASVLNIPIVAHEGKSKPSAVLYDALDSAKAKNYSILLVDTAGRLHNRPDLLEELSKLSRIISSKAPEAKVQNLLVLDSTMGQSALTQAREFSQYIDISGVILSKWDSSGKGGIVLSLSGELSLPIYFVGTGEKPEDLSVFDPQVFLSALLEAK